MGEENQKEPITPFKILRAILIGIALFLLVFCILVVFFSQAIFGLPRIVPDSAPLNNPPFMVSRSFPFENGSATVTIAVNASLYRDAKKTFRSTILLGDPRETGTRYYQAMINDPTQGPIYEDLRGQFRRIRDERNLTDDEYVEMIDAYVQTIPYKNGGNAPPKYPAELLAEGMGDCDDKAILLSGLLAREGYSVVLFKFGPESHMAMGIGSDAFLYKSTGYTYLEAMSPAYVGVPSSYIQSHRLLHSDPLVLPVSNGTRRYHSGNETQYIHAASLYAGEKTAELSVRLGSSSPLVQNSTEYSALMDEHDRYAAISAYIMNNPTNRPGVYAYVQRELPAVYGP